MSEFRVYLPRQNDKLEARMAYDTALNCVIVSFGGYLDTKASEAWGQNWFAQLMSAGHSYDEREKWKSIYDPTALFGELLNYSQSPLWQFVPDTDAFYQYLKKSRQVRNAWSHEYMKFDLNKLLVDLQHFRQLLSALDLPATKPLVGLGVRIKNVLNGEYAPTQLSAEEVDETTVRPQSERVNVAAAEAIERARAEELKAEKVAAEKEAQQPRPRVGAPWVGEKPTRALRTIPKLNDVVDRVTNESVRTELGDQAEAEIARWLAPKPLGDLFVDTDGAVLGYLQGSPYLLGYLGQQPQRNLDEIEGFALPASYSLVDGDIRDETTNMLLSKACSTDTTQLRAVIANAVNPLDELKITTHGDLFAYTEDGPVKILRVPSELWFPGLIPN